MVHSHVYSLRTEGWTCLFIEHAVRNLYYWWNMTKLWCKWTTGGRTRGKTDSPREIKQRNSWTTWKATSDSARAGNHRAKTTSVGSAKTAPSGLKQKNRGTADWNITGSTTKVAQAKRRGTIMHQSIPAVPIPPPRELAFFENELANAPPPGQKSCSNAPG